MRKLSLSLWLLTATVSYSGVLVVGGDINTLDTLPGGFQPLSTAFFDNLLGAGTNVAVRDAYPGYANLPNNYYNSLTGVTSSIIGLITPAALVSVDLLIAPAVAGYVGGEDAAIAAFLAGGGTVYLMGEHSGFPTENAALNALLSSIGSSMSLVPAFNDCGVQTASGGQIASHPLMSGVTSMTYGCSSTILGGTPLLFAKDLTTPMMAVEASGPGTEIPEPASLLLTAGGLGFLMLLRRKR